MPTTANKLNKKRDDWASIVAEMYDVTPGYVRQVRNGDRNNEEILATIMDLVEGKEKLVEAVKKLVPIDGPSAKTNRMKPVKK